MRETKVTNLAVGYVRCSTDEQGATSIPQQKEEILTWAGENGFTVVDWYSDEGKSGTDFLNRPAFSRLVRRVEQNPQFGYVLVYDESRWGRAINPRENAYWKMHLERHGIKVRIIHSSSRNEDDIGSYVIEVVESAEASEYSKKLSRAVRRGMMSDQQGKYSRGGTAPYGYKRIVIDMQSGERREIRDGLRTVPRQEKVVWELGDPSEVETVRKIYEMKVSGIGYVGIADRLNAQHIPCPRRGRWRNLDKKWSGGSIMTIIQNPSYTGDRVYNRLSFSKFVAREKGLTSGLNRFKRVNDKKDWIIIPDAHPAIVSRELFERANTPSPQRTSGKPNGFTYRSSYILGGLVRCERCRFNYQGFLHKKSGNRYYVDGGYLNKGKSVCDWFSIRQDTLEQFVLSSIRSSLLDSTFIEKTELYVKELFRAEPDAVHERSKEISMLIAEKEGHMQRLLQLAEKGAGLEMIAVRLRELEQEKRELEREQISLKRHPIQPANLSSFFQIVTDFLSDFEHRFEHLSILEKKEMLRKIVEKVEVNPWERKVHCHIRRIPRIPSIIEDPILGALSSANGNRTRI